MKIPATLFLISLATVSQAQFFKTLGFKTGVTRSYFTWKYRESSTSTYVGNDKSDKAIGLAFLLTGDVLDKKYWGVNLSAGWVQRDAKVRSFSFQTSYLSINPAINAKLPLGKSLNFYGQLGLRADYMLTHSNEITYYYLFYYSARENEIKKMNYGTTISAGLEKSFKKVIFRIEYAKLYNFNYIIDAKSYSQTGYGDAGFIFKLNSFTSMYTLNLAFKL